MQAEIVLPETKPETEWIDGHAVQKVSPTYDHGLLQRRIGAWLGQWADECGFGRVAIEWRFRVAPPADVVRPLVPDVSYLSYATLPREIARDEAAVPLGAPTVAFEVLSPDDREATLQSKIRTLLAAGTCAVVVVDPQTETVAVYDEAGTNVFRAPDGVEHPAMPGFVLDLTRLFADMD